MKKVSEVHFGELLRRAWQRSGLTQDDAALRFGIHRNNFAKYFKKSDLSTSVIKKACEVFNLDLSYFFRPTLTDARENTILEDPRSEYQTGAVSNLEHKILQEKYEAAQREIQLLRELVDLAKQKNNPGTGPGTTGTGINALKSNISY